MALPPVSDLHDEILSTDAASFASRRPDQDVVILEPHEPGRDYAGDLHGLASYVFLPRAANQPVPVGRDARAVVLLDHAAVSRLHMVMAWTGSAWQFMDRSSNGVFLHDQRVPKEQPTTLGYGTALRLGKALMLRVLTPEGLHQLVTKLRGAPVPSSGGGFDDAWGAPLTPQDPFQVGPGSAAAAPPPPPPVSPAPPPPAFAPAASAPPPHPGAVTEEFELDFDFGDAPVDPDYMGDSYDQDVAQAYMSPGAPPAPPTPPSPPAPPRAPAPPPTPPAPPPPVPDEISFDFDFDEADGRGGFA